MSVATIGNDLFRSVRLFCAVGAMCVLAATGSAAGEPVVVAAFGDYGIGGQAELDVSKLVKDWNPHAIITLGDNNYAQIESMDRFIGYYYSDFIFPYFGTYGPGGTTNRFFPTLGRHDYDRPFKVESYLDYFTLPGNERYYSFRLGPIDFFALNSNPQEPDGMTNGSVQAEWLRTQLAESTNAWRIVYFSDSPYSSGVYSPGVAEMRWPFAEWGASVVVSAHDHIYERIHTNNMRYFVSGLGGGVLQSVTTNIPGSQVRYNQRHGALRIVATETNLDLSFVTTNNLVIDAISITNSHAIAHFATRPQNTTGILSGTITLNAFAVGPGGEFTYQWYFGSNAIEGATNSSLTLSNLSYEDEGQYSVSASNRTAVLRESVSLSIARHPLISQQPANYTVIDGTNITFRVEASGYGPLRYQWLHNGNEISGATNSTHSITNVQAAHEGTYRVTVSDDFGTVASTEAMLDVKVRPHFVLRPPFRQGVVTGEVVVISYAVGGDWPITNIWGLSGAFQQRFTNVLTDSSVQFITISNVHRSGVVVIQLYNAVGSAMMVPGYDMLFDYDGDQMPSAWETTYGFNSSDPGDAGLDSDGDGASNRDEFLAGTIPNDPASALSLTATPGSSNRLALEFSTVPNKTYALQGADDLDAGWRNFAEYGAMTNAQTIRVTNAVEQSPKFYRVVTPRLP